MGKQQLGEALGGVSLYSEGKGTNTGSLADSGKPDNFYILGEGKAHTG